MAILIPSENIYSVKNNKIIDNIIDNIQVDEEVFNSYYSLIGDKKEVILTELENANSSTTKEVYDDNAKNIYETKVVSYDVSNGKYYYYQTKLSFDLTDTFLKPSDIYNLKFYNITNTFVRKFITESAFVWNTITSTLYSFTINEIISKLQNQETVSVNSCYIRELSVVDKTVNITVEAYKNYEGTDTIIAPLSASSYSFQLYGNVYKTEKKNFNYYLTTNNNDFLLNSNELQQSTNKYIEQKLNEFISNNILNDYLNGKETVTLSCTIDNYYEFDRNKNNLKGNKIISPNDKSLNKMTFDNYDIVLPTVLDINGNNKPISYYKNDTALLPKEFQVLKHKIIYNGMLKQELQCQETELGKDNYLIYEINFTVGRYNQNESDKGAKFKIKGKGDIYINDIFYNSFDYSTAYNIKIPYENINAETANFKFLGNFSQISTTSYNQTSGGSAYPQGKFNSVVQWDSRYFKTFEEQFIMQTLSSDFEIPSNITTISVSTFSEVKSQYLITIPKSVKTIEKKAFAYNSLTSIKFLHGENDTINLPTAGDINGAFYSKNAYNLTIYTDNLMIKNYDWATDNVTPTFYHLDGTLWE